MYPKNESPHLLPIGPLFVGPRHAAVSDGETVRVGAAMGFRFLAWS